MVHIFENKEKQSYYLISKNNSMIECKLGDLEKISEFYNKIYYREDVCDYIKEQNYSSAASDKELIDKITDSYFEYREESNYNWNTCLELAISEFEEELMNYQEGE